MDLSLITRYETETGASAFDVLTGLLSHGFFQFALDHELAIAKADGKPLAMGLLDVDWFFEFNREHGFRKGDRSLQEMGRIIKENLGETGIAARYGGDVFALALKDTDSRTALTTMERIRRSAETLSKGGLTVSIGLANYPADASACRDLIERAREALWQAKARGKNRTLLFKTEKRRPEDTHPKILFFTPEDTATSSFEKTLTSLNFDIMRAHPSGDARRILRKFAVDLMIMNIEGQPEDVFELCRHLKETGSSRHIPLLLLAPSLHPESGIPGLEAGADDVLLKDCDKQEVAARTRSLIRIKQLHGDLQGMEGVLCALASAVEARDGLTEGHIDRVSELAVVLGVSLGLSPRAVDALRIGAILHDIGKIGVPSSLLNQSGKLNPEKWEVMIKHPDLGYKICLSLKDTMGQALEAIRYHHEKLDGTGYPDGLKGEEIPLTARIMAVADIYDALLTERPYREALPHHLAVAILRREVEEGKLDGQVVDSLVALKGPGGDE